jgi:hypothetical protein
MKFYVKNHSSRVHGLDREILPGAGILPGLPAEEYSVEQMTARREAKSPAVYEVIAQAMGTMRHVLVSDGRGGDTSAAVPAPQPDLEVICEDSGKRIPLSAKELREVGAQLEKNGGKAEPPTDHAAELAELKAQLAAMKAAKAEAEATAGELLALLEKKADGKSEKNEGPKGGK